LLAKLTLEVSSPVAGLKTLLVLFEEPSKVVPFTKCFIILIVLIKMV
jgi:hypothetical protein